MTIFDVPANGDQNEVCKLQANLLPDHHAGKSGIPILFKTILERKEMLSYCSQGQAHCFTPEKFNRLEQAKQTIGELSLK